MDRTSARLLTAKRVASILASGRDGRQPPSSRGTRPGYLRLLVEDALADPLHRALFGASRDDAESILRERLEVFPGLWGAAKGLLPYLYLRRLHTRLLWSYVLPLAQFLAAWHEARTERRMVGFTGGPGAGKTTLVRFLRLALERLRPGWRVLNLSMDDFYYPREERLRRGFRWRAMPGTHDMALVMEVLGHIRQGAPEFQVPRYDQARDDRKGFERVEGPVDLCLLEGVAVGAASHGYEQVSRSLDFLAFLEMDLDQLKAKRLGRELRVRRRTSAGFTPDQMRQFWAEVLEPVTREHVLPSRERADLVITLSPQQMPVRAKLLRGPRSHGR